MAKLEQKLTEKKLEYLLLNSGFNRRYLTGFTGSTGWVLAGQGKIYLFVDSRYTELASKQSPHVQVIHIDRSFGSFWEEFSRSLKGRVGFESHLLTHEMLLSLRRKSSNSITLVPVSNIVEELRALKDRDEVALIQRSVDASDRAFTALLGLIKPGMTELEIAWLLEKLIREEGAERIAWHPLIVASGASSSMPHYQPSEQKIREKDMLLMDFGAVVEGYHSDITRVVFLGKPTDEQAKVYQAVLESQERAQDRIRHHARSQDIDSLARTTLEEYNYEPYGHGLSHGIGLEVHELPRVSKFSQDVLAAGNVISVEPGIYIPGWGGIRIEDLVLVTQNGIETLTKSPKKVTDVTI